MSRDGYKTVKKSRSKSKKKSNVTHRSRAKKSKTRAASRLKNSKSKSNTTSRAKSKTRTSKSKKKVTLNEVYKIGNKLNVDFTKLDPKVLQHGMNVELEHGYVDRRTNVTNDNLILTAKIALAHIVEVPDYYVRLKKMEKSADIYWKNKTKVDPFKKVV